MPPVSDPMSRVRDRNSSFKKASKELEKSTLHVQVRTFRDLLRTEPRDPITWVELSHAYALLGIKEQAERSMTIALQLAMNNRFIIRSASRLWIYLDDPERAHDLIIRADRTPHDPWLLAAEIAVGSAAKRKPRFVKIARRMLSESRFLNIHTSELASAVATLELNSSNIKRSKRLFDLSLRSLFKTPIGPLCGGIKYFGVKRFS